MSWIKKLQKKWNLGSVRQVILILIVFSCTGTTVLFVRTPIEELISGGNEKEWWMTVIYFILILPIYNILLLSYGFLFGQWDFFMKYEKRMFRRMFGKRKKIKEPLKEEVKKNS